MACVEHCPVYIDPTDKIIDMRRYQVMGRGLLPNEAKPMIRNLEIFGDVQGRGIAYRGDWAFNRRVSHFADKDFDGEILLWVGCSGAFHPLYQETVRAMVKILNADGVHFGILGKEECCWGDPARRLGEESFFLDLARRNISRFAHYHVQKIVVLCPHCFNTLKNEYPCLLDDPQKGSGTSFEVIHGTEFIMTLIKEKCISPKFPMAQMVTIHDPCYLGRANQIYRPLRDLCMSIQGLEIKELKRTQEDGFCCGGGGRMWLHEKFGRHINQIRAREVLEAEVDLVATACPYCLIMLDDGIKSLELAKPPEVLDMIEIVASSLG